MRYLSLFSGFGGAELAWQDLGWECVAVAEIDPQAAAVLKYRWPRVPNLGDIEKITEEQIVALGHIDLVVFGSPCQDLSVAGKRAGLEGARSGLFFDAVRIIRWANARLALWENVPGAFSSQSGRDFALVVGELAGVQVDVPDGGWRNAGFLAGPDALVEWAVLDAQFFGVPQRRRRVFALRDTGDWRSRPPILLEPQSLCGYPPPRREAGKGNTHSVAPSLTNSGRGVERGGDSRGQDPVVAVAWGGNNTSGPIDQATAVNAHGGPAGRIDFESETFIQEIATSFDASYGRLQGAPSDTVPPLSADADKGDQDTLVAFDARQDPCNYGDQSGSFGVSLPQSIAIAIQERPICENPDAGPDGVGVREDDTAYTVEARQVPQAVAYDLRNMAEGDVTQTLQAAGLGSERGGNPSAIPAAMSFAENIRGELRESEAAEPLKGGGGKPGQGYAALKTGMQVRRLTPIETARLQGVPDNYCRIPYKGKPMADGPIYKMHGNGFCVPVVRWIGERIDAFINKP